MNIELVVISSLPTKEKGLSIAKYIPLEVKQKKVFTLEDIKLEEYIDTKGKHNKKYCFIKSDNENYKINKPYEEIKNKYFKNLEILGFNAKRSNYTNL